MVGGTLDNDTQGKLTKVLGAIDKRVEEIARERRLFPAQIKLLQPVNFCAVVADDTIYIAATNMNTGGMPRHQFVDWQGLEMNIQTAIYLATRDLAFENPFGIQFAKNILDLPEEEIEEAASGIAEQYIHDELINLERLSRMVRINPIFSGRDFLINEKLVFVLSPFAEPFNTIYNDHIKTTVESINDFTCLRADDIYDNRPIIEDIWKHINESRIVISELTGKNPNVFYETGVAHTVGKEVILITQTMEDVPFDLRHLRCIVYEYTPRGVQTLQDNIQNTILQILQRNNSTF